MEFVNTDMRKDIRDILLKHRCLYKSRGMICGSSRHNEPLQENEDLVNDIENLIEKWWSLRTEACLV